MATTNTRENGSGKLAPRSQRERAHEEFVENERTEQETLLDTLATLGGKLMGDEDVIFRGTQLIVPETLADLEAAERFLREKRDEDEKPTSFSRTFRYRPMDGARSTMNALKKAFGIVASRPMPWGAPPTLMTIPVSAHDTEQVPWGGVAVSHLPGLTLYVGQTEDEELGTLYELTARGPRKYRHHVEGIFRLVEQELAKNSLYRGKAFDGQSTPQFIDVDGIDPKKIVYADDVMTQLEANLWGLIRYAPAMRKAGVPLKRSTLLEGPYGTGKTCAGLLTAQIAVKHGWAFIMCRPGRDSLQYAMSTARLYAPAIVFFEDVDTEGSPGESIGKVLDLFDGLPTKGTEIMAVLTTNHVEALHMGMMRPGRIDAVIHVAELDDAGVQRLVRAVVPEDMLDPDIEWDDVCTAMRGFLPAFCTEAIDRTKRYSLVANAGRSTVLTTQNFVDAAMGLRPQLGLMENASEGGGGADHVGMALARVVQGAMMPVISAEFQASMEGTDAIVRGRIDRDAREMVAEVTNNVIDQKLDGAWLVDTDDDERYKIVTN